MACPKDDFPLPLIEIIVDNSYWFERMTFMDGFSGYKEIRMNSFDERHTSFMTPLRVYCYTVMPFGLKNVGATYQKAMMKIQHKTVESYVDDLAVKSNRGSDHLIDLGEVFQHLRKYNMKMNPLKCFFGVTSGRFLEFIIRKDGIQLDLAKVEAILKMPTLSTIKKLRSLQRKLAYIRRLISNLTGRCSPFSKIMKKGVTLKWSPECEATFRRLKEYLMKPLVLMVPVLEKDLILYTRALDHSLGALLAQKNDDGQEVALYYLSRVMIRAEHNYPLMEKDCLALMFTLSKLRHYLMLHRTQLVSRVNLIKVLMTKLGLLNPMMVKWPILLSQFDIEYVPQKAMKGQALVDFLATHLLQERSQLAGQLQDKLPLSVKVLLTQEACW
ncbi:hypothetical protein AAC387_Pa03g1672 [Persea americana]